MTHLLEGKVALITGCGSGIGRASALAFARACAIVICADVNQEGGEETVDLFREAHGKAEFVQAEVTDANRVQALVVRIVTAHGRFRLRFQQRRYRGRRDGDARGLRSQFELVIAVKVKGVWLDSKVSWWPFVYPAQTLTEFARTLIAPVLGQHLKDAAARAGQ